MEDLRTLLPRGSILIVDDSTGWRAIVREILKAQPGLQLVAEACDGLDAVYKATKLHPDLVLLDIGTPVMNGLVLLIPSGRCLRDQGLCFSLRRTSRVHFQYISMCASSKCRVAY